MFGQAFFVMLLPPIIFEAGYSMNRASFFANFGGICVFAFAGTMVSAAVVGLLLFAAAQLGFVYSFSMVDALVFGALISATDPVTVLAVFQTLGVDRTLYALVFGESVLNDAVAIVLYHTMLTFQTGVSAGGVGAAILFFLVNFLGTPRSELAPRVAWLTLAVSPAPGSLAIGVAVGVLSALLFRHTDMSTRQLRGLERSLSVLLPFLAYMLAEGIRVSGVVAILFAGITSAHYTIRNLSDDARRFSLQFFKALAMLFESLVFVFIGLACPLLFSKLAGDNWAFLCVSVVIVLIARYVIVYGGAKLVNLCRSPRQAITKPVQFVLWFSGLRGGVAFALSTQARATLLDSYSAELIELATLLIVVLSMLVVGGTVSASTPALCAPAALLTRALPAGADRTHRATLRPGRPD